MSWYNEQFRTILEVNEIAYSLNVSIGCIIRFKKLKKTFFIDGSHILTLEKEKLLPKGGVGGPG